jgi:hypothetical protein
MIILNSNQILNELLWSRFNKFASRSLFKKKKKKKLMITIVVIQIKFKEHIYKMDIANKLTIIFHKHSLKKHGIVLI